MRVAYDSSLKGEIWHRSSGLVGAIFRQDFCSTGSFFVAHINMTNPWHYLKELSKKEQRNKLIGSRLN